MFRNVLFSFEGANLQFKRANRPQEERLASADNAQVPPVPIPNTVVKLSRAENTCLETDRENRKVLALFFYIFSFSSVGRAADC